MPRQQKSQATSSRVGLSNGFGSTGATGFGTSSSTISYLTEQPDLSHLSDPNISVQFKNLSKKDSTTKSRALDELQSHVHLFVNGNDVLEDPFLEAWVKVYPRLSIDLSRRVRQVSHVVQGKVSTATGKRMARHMPAVVPSWLSGVHDGDKAVMRTAQETLREAFPTQEKRFTLKKAFQGALLNYCSNAVNLETPNTLNDERSTKPEDAEAVYARVIASSLSAVSDLVETLEITDLEKQNDMYDELIGSEKLWLLLSSKDASVRRAVMRFLRTCVSKFSHMVEAHLSAVTKAMMSKQTMRHQSSSAVQYADLLLILTEKHPDIWSQEFKSKATPDERIQNLVKYGAHSGPPQFWTTAKSILGLIPSETFPNDVERGNSLLNAMRIGITGKDELRGNYSEAMDCFFAAMDRIVKSLPDTEKSEFVAIHGFPVIMHYMKPAEDALWKFPTTAASAVVSGAVRYDSMKKVLQEEWPRITDELTTQMQVSLPEQSKDFEASQHEVETKSSKYFVLHTVLFNSGVTPSTQSVLLDAREKVISTAMDQIRNRNGKPYGAAACIIAALDSVGIEENPPEGVLDAFIEHDVASLIASPSNTRLITILYRCSASDVFPSAWRKVTDALLSQADSTTKRDAMQTFLTAQSTERGLELIKTHEQLQIYIRNQTLHQLDEGQDLSFSEKILDKASSVLSEATAQSILNHLVSSLLVEDRTETSLSILVRATRYNKEIIKNFLKSTEGPSLLQNLLTVQEGVEEHEVATAKRLSQTIQSIASSDPSQLGGGSAQAVLQRGLHEANEHSLSVDTLVDYAIQQTELLRAGELQSLLPRGDLWREKLSKYLDTRPPNSSSISENLGGTIFTIDDATVPAKTPAEADSEGYTPVLRMAMYTTDLLLRLKQTELPTAARSEVACNVLLTALFANDKLGNNRANDLWVGDDEQAANDVSEFISKAKKMVTVLTREELAAIAGKNTSTWPETTFGELWGKVDSVSAASYNYARAFSESLAQVIEQQGFPREGIAVLDEEATKLYRNKNIVQFAAFIKAFQSPLLGTPGLTRIVNELVAGLTSPSVVSKPKEMMTSLISLNLIVADHEGTLDTVAKQRAVFFTKNMIPLLKSSDTSDELKAEICKILAALLPQIIEIYGEFWEESIEFLQHSFANAEPLSAQTYMGALVSLRHAMLRLFGALRSLTFEEEANDDLKDAWAEALPALSNGLVSLVKASSAVSDVSSQALRITTDLLARLVSANPPKQLQSNEEMFALLSADSHAIQKTAFNILHEQIPKAQEDVSLAAALDKKTARLPEELLSLVIAAPATEYSHPAAFESQVPPTVLTYMSSWLLVFDHFRKASDRVKTDYATHLKEGAYIDPLLDFVFSFLGVSRSRPVDAGKFEPTFYSFDVETEPLKDARWLTVHLYYLCLKRVPSLTRAWLSDHAPRQTRTQAEPWTEKHFSPLIISDALEAASQWASKQPGSADEVLDIKTNARTREVRAAREIDDQMLAIVVRLPGNFPLGQVAVEGLNRVAVDERRWRSWLMNTAGVIAFSDNSIAEGLMAFARNVSGQMKGQTECAICYSIVGQDRSLPTKKCQTCKNAFHGACLYRWFRSSNSSSCPLCRTAFNYA